MKTNNLPLVASLLFLFTPIIGFADTQPMPNAQMAMVLVELAALNGKPVETLSAKEARKQPSPADAVMALLKKQGKSTKPEEVFDVDNTSFSTTAGSVPTRVYSPKGGGPFPLIVYIHGGGWVIADLDTYDATPRALSNLTHSVVVSLEYPKAPEHKFPAGLVDAAFAVDWVARHAASVGIDPARLAIGGESAGALLAALIGNGYHTIATPLKAQLLLCPVLDLTGTLPSRAAYGRGYLIDETIVQRDIADCLAEGARPETLPSPLRAGKPELSPPAIIVSAECDPFRDEAKHYGELLERAGVPVWHTCHAGMIHSFYGLSAFLPGAGPALQAAGQQLKALLC